MTFQVVVPPPVLSLRIPAAGNGSQLGAVEGSAVTVQVSRSGGDKTQAVQASYQVEGGAAGKDYQALGGKVTIPAGKSSATIKLRLLKDGVADGDKTLKLRLLSSAKKVYTLGTATTVKVRVVDVD